MKQGGGLFVYGTLRHLPLLEALLGGPVDYVPAVLPDHGTVCWPDAPFPYITEMPGVAAPGLFLPELTERQRVVLDTYEVPFGYFPKMTEIVLQGSADGNAKAAVYFPDPSVGRSDQLWRLEDWVVSHAEVSVHAAIEIAAHDPPLGPDELRRQWPMIQARAYSKSRAGNEVRPAGLRFDGSGEFSIKPRGPVTGSFFKLAGMTAEYTRFDKKQSGGLLRETLVGVDAALILPYDAERNHVMLVEQFRAGPARRGDLNPWSLEPVAGIIDAGETPVEAALRECEEEAGLVLTDAEPMFQMYPSPGSSTDCFYCFLGRADLPKEGTAFGGLATEDEDLRLHVVSLERALDLTESGEANAGPLIAMLLWVWRHRDRLRNA